jgi:tRNA threonylcarbamoyladenosine biosynthesis protein TsaE
MFREVSLDVFHSVGLEDLREVVRQMLKDAGECKVWLFRGEMGAGKTTFIKEVCRELGVEDDMSSPTFSIINEYRTRTGNKIFHFDFFRIKGEAEAYDIGAEEYFYSGDYCFIEWPEKIPGLIPAEHALIEITLENNTLRTIAISVHDGQEKNRV